MKFHLIDERSRRKVVVEEKHSIIILIIMIFVILTMIAQFIHVMLLFVVNVFLGLYSLVSMVLLFIYVFVLNHLRRKADMSVRIATFKTINGKTIVVKKVSSFWITLALIIDYFLIAIVIISIVFILVKQQVSTITSLIILGLGLFSIILLYIIARILGFLRTKLDFDGEEFYTVSIEGVVLKFYKDRSFWITLALIITIIEAVTALVLAFMIISNTIVLPEDLIYRITGYHWLETMEELKLLLVISLVITTIIYSIIATILNFLRVRVHIIIASTSYSTTPNKALENDNSLI